MFQSKDCVDSSGDTAIMLNTFWRILCYNTVHLYYNIAIKFWGTFVKSYSLKLKLSLDRTGQVFTWKTGCKSFTYDIYFVIYFAPALTDINTFLFSSFFFFPPWKVSLVIIEGHYESFKKCFVTIVVNIRWKKTTT